MRIFITGATGFLGNNLVRALLAEGHEIVAAVRHSSDPRPLSGLKIDLADVDLTDPQDVNPLVADADLVIHSAAMIHVGWKKMAESRRFNVESTRNIAIAARRNKIRMVHVSTVDTLAAATQDSVADEDMLEPSKPACAYVVSKREAEQVVLQEVERGLDAVIVNPGFMIGPWDWKPSSGKMMIMLSKQPLLFYAPAGGCSVVDVRDVSEGIISATQHGRSGQRYILGGENLTYLDLWQLMARVMNKRPPVRRMSDFLAGGVGRFGDFVSRFTRTELEVNSAVTLSGQMYSWYSSQKAEQELGYRPGSVEDAIRDAWDWFQQFDYVKSVNK